MLKHEIEAAKVKGLLNTLSNKLTRMELDCTFDNVEKTYGKIVELMPYVREIETICNDIYEEEAKLTKEGDDWI